MRTHILPVDAAICLGIAALISIPVGHFTNTLISDSFDTKKEALAPEAGNIGGLATDDVFRAESVDDMLSHDTFTVECLYRDAYGSANGYHDGMSLNRLTLSSGESVAYRANTENVVHTGGDSFSSDTIVLPVGKVVYEDLSKDTAFLSQIEYREPLSRTDFYVDMAGSAFMESKDQTVNVSSLWAQIITVVILYPIFHAIGSKIGLWESYFTIINHGRE